MVLEYVDTIQLIAIILFVLYNLFYLLNFFNFMFVMTCGACLLIISGDLTVYTLNALCDDKP